MVNPSDLQNVGDSSRRKFVQSTLRTIFVVLFTTSFSFYSDYKLLLNNKKKSVAFGGSRQSGHSGQHHGLDTSLYKLDSSGFFVSSLHINAHEATTTLFAPEDFENELEEEIEVAASFESDRDLLNMSNLNFFDARDAQGNLGYVADPTSLRKSLHKFLTERLVRTRNMSSHHGNRTFQHGNGTDLLTAHHPYFDVLSHFMNTTYSLHDTCKLTGGKGPERDGGFELLSRKIRIFPQPEDNNNTRSETSRVNEPKLLCIMYTAASSKPALTKANILTWGHKCDGFLAFSTETIADLGILDLIHPGEEAYGNMWQKVRSMWGYVGKHYLDDYDYFHIGGNDMYLLVENLRHFIRTKLVPFKDQPLITGLEVKGIQGIMFHGGPGYTMNRAGLSLFIQEALINRRCSAGAIVSAEDRFISNCFRLELGVNLTDSRDPETAEQRYHILNPNGVYTHQIGEGRGYLNTAYSQHSANRHHPTRLNETVGERIHLDAAYTYTAAFHQVRQVEEATRYTAIIYDMCPANTPLGSSLHTVLQEVQ